MPPLKVKVYQHCVTTAKMSASTRSRSRANREKELRLKAERLLVEEPPVYQPWTPSAYTAFKLILSARLCAAIWSNISDCDEVFNYWEPVHYLVHGSGFQTWEYSPAYAIRSYAYLWLHVFPLRIYATFLQAHKILQFYFLRCLLGFICALCEVYFYRGVCKHLGANTGRLMLVFLLFSTGMFISCSTLLPSSFTMYCTMTATAAWFLGHHPVAIFSTAAAAIVGWPFAGALGIPIAYDMVIRKPRIWMFIKWSIISGVVCLVPLVQVDSHYYGGLVIAPLNIVLYNVFSEHGPEIYGVEPWYFYLLNGFLNFNIAFPMALLVLPVALLGRFMLKQEDRGSIPLWLSLTPMYIWVLIFFTRPHKEERFLFPVYPLFCLTAAVALDHVQKVLGLLAAQKGTKHYTLVTGWLAIAVSVPFAILSMSRTAGLYQGYHAPLDVYVELTRLAAEEQVGHIPRDQPINVCVGKEWYRYPSSFFLPDDRWHLQFIQSEFRGQLPKPYEQGPGGTQKEPAHMNDMNREEASRYVNVTECDYLIDLDLPDETRHEPRYSLDKVTWKLISSSTFMDASRSDRLLRAFYIPFLSEHYCTYADYVLLERIPVHTPHRIKRPNKGH